MEARGSSDLFVSGPKAGKIYVWNPKGKQVLRRPRTHNNPEVPSTQYLGTLVPKTIPLMVFGTQGLQSWVLGPSGQPGALRYSRLSSPKFWQLALDNHMGIKTPNSRGLRPLLGCFKAEGTMQALKAWRDKVRYILGQLPQSETPSDRLMSKWLFERLKKALQLCTHTDRVRDSPEGSEERRFDWLWTRLERRIFEGQQEQNLQSIQDSLRKGPRKEHVGGATATAAEKEKERKQQAAKAKATAAAASAAAVAKSHPNKLVSKWKSDKGKG